MTDAKTQEVCAVVVTYHPDPVALWELLGAITDQAGAVVVVDNTSATDVGQFGVAVPKAVSVLHQPSNHGLAVAQNRGIEWARARGYRYVLLLDQDSVPGAGMVAALLLALQRLRDAGPVGAVGPRFHDLREDRGAPFVRIGFPLNRKLHCESAGQTVGCDFLISSGALIPMEVLDDIGAMDAGLFIDNIDLEWSFRARSRGYALYGVCAATMNHKLGDARHALPLGLGTVVVHGPVRLYYMMRNRMRLYRMPHTPRVWILQDLPRVWVKLLLFGVLIGPRWRNLRFMLRGIGDGLHGIEGACPLRLGD